ncbi:MAG: hypothetical protein HC906_13160 [Bacteroidales bacterium]|nr:hypothetical protein [Bacteroidales bacterium]
MNKYLYTINGNGILSLQHEVIPQGLMPAWLQRVGLQFSINNDLQKVEWYGRGPHENYPDRKTGAKIGIYESTINSLKENYLVPQDYGLRTDNRWLKMETENGIGIEISGDKLFNFNAYPYSTDHLTRARYPYQLMTNGTTTLNIDYATSGVGCTAISVLNQYRVLPGVYHFNLQLKPYKREFKLKQK